MKRWSLLVALLALIAIPPAHAQDSLNVTEVGFCTTGGQATDVQVHGNYAYVANWDSGVAIIDVSDPANPQLVGTYQTVGQADDCDAAGDYLSIADRTVGLVVLNISDPSTPTLEGSVAARSTYSNALVSDGDYVYFADGNNGVGVYDISDPANPFETGFSGDAYPELDVTKDGNRVYSADRQLGIHIFDVSSPSSPREVGSYVPLRVDMSRRSARMAISAGLRTTRVISNCSMSRACATSPVTVPSTCRGFPRWAARFMAGTPLSPMATAVCGSTPLSTPMTSMRQAIIRMA